MLRLAYLSTLQSNIDADAKRALVEHAAFLNKQSEIGGVIAFDGQRVCQILEGEADIVTKLFARIERDPRHFSVFELDRSEVSKRLFSDWGMTKRPMADMVMYAYSILP